jgi:hypothetical protein
MALCHFQQYFSYIVAVSIIGGGNQSTGRKPLTCPENILFKLFFHGRIFSSIKWYFDERVDPDNDKCLIVIKGCHGRMVFE